ncbi:MAG TPA: DUF4411 family protein [Euryarchaeota archaeon]|nr:DUF4411 family protein [Euryarchaeota archaeon]
MIVYIIDSSSLIDLNKRNPMDVYPGVWRKMEGLIIKHRLFAPKEVLNEIMEYDDVLAEWGKNNKNMFVEPTEDQIEIVREILEKFPSIIKINKRNCADPWVIALAIEMNRSTQQTLIEIRRIVVTEEKLRGNKVRIPFVCSYFTVEVIDIIGMFRTEGWKF